MRYAAVYVSGDLGRSPRMQNHALQLAQQTGLQVLLMGYSQSKVHDSLLNHPQITLKDSPLTYGLLRTAQGILPRLLYYLFRILVETVSLLCTFLFCTPRLEVVIVQNPPSIPVLFALWLACLLRGTYFLVDFHNYGYSIMALSTSNRYLIQLAHRLEFLFGARADHVFCVSQGMQTDLRDRYRIESETLYDRCNSSTFRRLEPVQKKEVLTRLGLPCEPNTVTVISSTSWTPDENFQTLLDALLLYEEKAEAEAARLSVVITGKGPMKEHFRGEIEARQAQWKHIQVRLLWLEPEDYPLLLGAADLGVCLHESSSGLDLPMKVVDMFGCQLPVMAYEYPCINELVNPHNGWLFHDAPSLYRLLSHTLSKWPQGQAHLQHKSAHLAHWRQHSWEKEWQQVVLPVVQSLLQNRKWAVWRWLVVVVVVVVVLCY